MTEQTGYGYGCQLPAMVAAWRQQWSAVPGTTHPLAPFGVVTLAAGGSEGHAQAMAGMRWSQTGDSRLYMRSDEMPGAQRGFHPT